MSDRKSYVAYTQTPPPIPQEIPDEDIIAYIDATKNKLRVLQRGFDPDMLKISRRRRHKVSPGIVEPQVEPSKPEMVSTYMRLSMDNTDLLTIRFLNLANFIANRCLSQRLCRLRACPLCLHRRLQYESRLVTRRRAPPKEQLVSFLSGLVDVSRLESTAEALYITVRKFLRKSRDWPQKPSAFVFRLRVRPVLVDGHTMFRLSVGILVVMSSHLDTSELKKRWNRQLKLAGLRLRPEGGKPNLVVRVVQDLDTYASKLVGSVKTILGPIASMNPEEASAYSHVLAMRSDLFVSDDWSGSA